MPAPVPPPSPLNIVYIHSHDTGRHIQPYGQAISTPHLQALAERGALFRQAFCAGPTCSPSRAALLTGANPHRNGMIGLEHRGFRIHHPEWHLANYLGQHGYHTAAIGIEHVSDKLPVNPWHHRALLSNSASERVQASLDWLGNADGQGRQEEKQFFLSLGFFETHRAFPAPGPAVDARYTQPPACLPDTPETRADMAAYHQMARDLDDAVGEFLAGLAELGLAENTLIISTTDHGIAFPRMKCNLEDTGIGVMLILAGPESATGIRPGSVVEAMVTHLDLYPTVCELAGVPQPEWVEGKSLLPLLRGELDTTSPTALHEEIFAEVTYHAAYQPQRCVRTARWKYIRRYEGNFEVVTANVDDGPSKELWLEAGWRGTLQAEEALYDLMFDPMEGNNLAQRPEYAGTLQEMRARLQAWMERTDDPLRHGPVPLPEGCVIKGPGQPK